MTSSSEPLLPARMPLMRPKHGRWLTGVCKGIALHLGVSVVWVRLAFIVLTCLYGAGIIAYVFLWILVPAGDPQDAANSEYAVPVEQAPLARGNRPAEAAAGEQTVSPESLSEAIRRAPKPALVALAGFALMAIGLLLVSTGADSQIIMPLLLGLAGIALAWMNLSPNGTQLLSMLGGIALIFVGWAIYVSNVSYVGWGTSPRRIMISGLIMIICIVMAVLPWANAMIQRLTSEQALKEREEERADMTAHLHDGVLQTLALIQLHSEEPSTVFTLARGQERELREWLYQERSTSDRSVGAGLKQIAAEVEDEHGKPQVVLLDVHVPGGEGGGGAEILTKSRTYSPTTVFLALSVSDAPQDVGSVIRAGAQGYVTKTITGADLISSIKQVHEGYAVFSPKLAGFVLSAFQGVPTAGVDDAAPAHDEELDRLSAREQEVMRLIARGYTYKEVAAELFISIKTVETHVSSVLRKLQLSNRTELTRWAADRRIV